MNWHIPTRARRVAAGQERPKFALQHRVGAVAGARGWAAEPLIKGSHKQILERCFIAFQ
jgi:hypothetical protein